MMNLRELRLGNWVSILDIGKYVKIESIHSEFVTIKDHVTWDYVYADMIEPIPITEEILLKCGFEKTDNYGYVIYYEPKDRGNRNYYICFDHEAIVFGLNVFGNCTVLLYDDANLQFLHQLQNLYFTLTGEELNIEL